MAPSPPNHGRLTPKQRVHHEESGQNVQGSPGAPMGVPGAIPHHSMSSRKAQRSHPVGGDSEDGTICSFSFLFFANDEAHHVLVRRSRPFVDTLLQMNMDPENHLHHWAGRMQIVLPMSCRGPCSQSMLQGAHDGVILLARPLLAPASASASARLPSSSARSHRGRRSAWRGSSEVRWWTWRRCRSRPATTSR